MNADLLRLRKRRLMSKVGIDVRPGIHVEEIQICPNGRGIIFITLKQEISIQQFCQYNVIEVNSNGVRAVNIKPAFKREVVVSLRNIHPNTKDEYVINYLNRFGKVVSNKVVYGVYTEGPLKGFRNGDRSYKVELKPQINLGTYHVLDGQKVIVKHEGQLQTCARCLESARTCKGRGTARRCEEQGGVKADFTKYIKDLWKDIGYCPESDIQEIPTDEYEDEYDPNILRQIGGGFTPQSSNHQDRIDAYSGINLRSFSKDTDQCEIVDLLISAGLPVDRAESVVIKPNGSVFIKDLTNSCCLNIIGALHNKIYLGRKLFCNGVIGLTPEKTPSLENSENSEHVDDSSASNQKKTALGIKSKSDMSVVTSDSTPVVSLPEPSSSTLRDDNNESDLNKSPLANINTSVPQVTVTSEISESRALPDASFTSIGVAQDIEQFVKDNELKLNEDLVRRNSLSLRQRTPPRNSLAAEILRTPSSVAQDIEQFVKENGGLRHITPPSNSLVADIPHTPSSASLDNAKSLLEEVRSLATKLSEYETCDSSEGDGEVAEDTTENEAFQTMNERKRQWRNKRKKSGLPTASGFLKKANKNPTPPKTTQ